MKKLMIIAALFTASVAASAQGVWEKAFTKGDELKGTKSSEIHMCRDKDCAFICWSWKEYQFGLMTDQQFNIESGYAQYVGTYAGINILVGLYDKDDNMIEKFEMWLDKVDNAGNRLVRTRDQGSMMNPVGQKKKVKKIFEHLQKTDGYVRIVASRFQTTDFDLKMPHYTE